MAALATAQDVADRWRPLTADETNVAFALLEDASAIVRYNVPGIDARIAIDADLAAIARGVVASMVKNVLMNPEGFAQEAIDDWRGVRDAVRASGLLYLGVDQVALLSPSGPTGLGQAFVVSLGGS